MEPNAPSLPATESLWSIVIDGWLRVSVSGIDLITIEAHVIVASIDTYLGHWPAFDGAAALAKRSSIFDLPS